MTREVRLERSAELPEAARIPGLSDLRLSLLTAGDMGPSGAGNQRRDAWLQRQGVAPEWTALRRQTHSRHVAVVEADSVLQRDSEADGMICADRRVSLAVTVADCMPIFVYDRRSGVRAVLHSGWKGTGILTVALDLMQMSWNSVAADIAVVLGPCIGVCCYQVDETRAAAFGGQWGAQTVRTDSRGDHYLDLRAANLAILRARSVKGITVVGDCTVCNRELGSYRRQGASNFTRMLAIVMGRDGQQ